MKLTRRQMTGGIAALAVTASALPARTETAMENLPFAATTPVSIGRVGLMARDGSRVADYYKSVLGLTELRRAGNVVVLGAGDRELLEIEEWSALRQDDPRSAGLFHTAFLLPTRKDLARWTRHAIDTRIPVDGASDHLVSEAIYLTDPEGNGIEIYADRPRENWIFDGPSVRMATDALDVANLIGELSSDEPEWKAAPDKTVVGHVHLRVGDATTAEQWWREEQGFDTMQSLGGQAVFLSSGGYHHHIGANSWRSRGAGPREMDRTGLGFVELLSKDATAETASRDPWGNEIRVLPAG
ncbi:VOC family protein [Neoaquamicrobium sediminum]|uniref:VOC family protein n=1 Tax=Neoaquamicrobium sediminum TaxID=1849104 RepID=UPI003F6771A4